MLKHSIVIAAGIVSLHFTASAWAGDDILRVAQLGPPPAGSALGTESGSYGSSIGIDVRGSSQADIMNPHDPIEQTDPKKLKEQKEQREREAREKDAARANERLDPRSNPGYNTRATENARGPAAGMSGETRTPGSPEAAGGTPGSAAPGSRSGGDSGSPR